MPSRARNRSLKAVDGTKTQQNIHLSVVAMVNKAEHRYQVNASVSGRAIVATQILSKSITAQSLTRIAEGLCRYQVTRKKICCQEHRPVLLLCGGQKS
jgi:hypothetical protein